MFLDVVDPSAAARPFDKDESGLCNFASLLLAVWTIRLRPGGIRADLRHLRPEYPVQTIEMNGFGGCESVVP